MKKILLMTAVILFIFCSVTSYAEGFELTVDSKSAKAGETVAVNLTFSDNPGIIAALFELSYDRERLELIKAEDNGLLPGAVFSQSYDKYPYIMLWNSSSAKDFTENGTLVTLTFKVPDNAKSGNAFINISYIPDNVYNADLNNVDLDIINGAIDVEGALSSNTASSGTGSRPSATAPVIRDTQTNIESVKKGLSFGDVKSTDWYYDAVSYVFENNLMKGTTDTSFSPALPLTRGMLVTILHRIEGTPSVNSNSIFKDVSNDMYYADAVKWAKSTGIVNGVTENEFAPDKNITREQIVIILHRYATLKGYDVRAGKNTSVSEYDDFSSVSEYAIEAMQYAVGSGLIKGDTIGKLNPQGNATRAEIATILHRFIERNTL